MHKDDILRLLRASRSGFVSGTVLASAMGISRAAVWKHVKSLEQEGYGIEAVPSKGYRLLSAPDLIVPREVQEGLKTKSIGREIVHRIETGSTNSLAMELAQQGAADGTAVVAESQTAGKGRRGRNWVSPRGNLYFSVVLRPPVPVHKAPLITLMGAVAVAFAIRNHLGIPAAIKWPNDILVSGKKVSGLLTEMSAEPDRIRHIVLGIGVNVNMDLRSLPPDVRNRSTTLAAAAGKSIERTGLLKAIFTELEHWYRRFLKQETDVLAAWQELNATLGKRVAVSGAGELLEGQAMGVDAEGRLLLTLDDGTVRQVAAGDVTIVKGNF